MHHEDLTLGEALKTAQRVTVMTGAGISAESGVPTFRGADGLWKGRRPEELATAQAFARNPEEVWDFYDWRRTLLAGCEPNPGHRAIAELEDLVPEFLLVTQNVDGLHQAAGSRRVVELHGNIWRVRCFGSCGGEGVIDKRAPLPRPLPPRHLCGAALRPGVVWFGEQLPFEALSQADLAARASQVFLVIGTSGVVEPAASLARIAAMGEARVVEINPEPTPLSEVATDIFRESAATALPRIIEEMKNS